MIQRIQTLFLLCTAGLLAAMYFVPLAFLYADDGVFYQLTVAGLKTVTGDEPDVLWLIPLLILHSVTLLLVVYTIFLYANRRKQARICMLNIILSAGVSLLMMFYILSLSREMLASVQYRIPVVFPLAGIILLFLALRAIRKDEERVRSYERLR